MRRPTLWIAGLLILGALAVVGYRALASDTTRIRWQIQAAAEAFNDTHLAGCLGALTPDYRAAAAGGGGEAIDRAALANVLRHLFLTRIDDRTKRFLWRVRVPDETLAVQVPDGAETGATADFDLHLEERQGDDWLPRWHLRVRASLRVEAGEWRIERSSHETLAGSRPR